MITQSHAAPHRLTSAMEPTNPISISPSANPRARSAVLRVAEKFAADGREAA